MKSTVIESQLNDRSITLESDSLGTNLRIRNLITYDNELAFLSPLGARQLIDALTPYAAPPVVVPEPSPPLHFDVELKLREPKYRMIQTNLPWEMRSHTYPGEYALSECQANAARYAAVGVTYRFEPVEPVEPVEPRYRIVLQPSGRPSMAYKGAYSKTEADRLAARDPFTYRAERIDV